MRVLQWRAGPMQNFVYVLHDDAGGPAVVVDPAFEKERLVDALAKTGLRIERILATHGHPDHVQATGHVRDKTGARVVAHESADHAPIDVRVKHGERFRVGTMEFEVLHTPGHRFDSVCYLVDGTHLITGDTLFVGECGRVDLPGSDPVAMHRSLLTTLAALPGELIVLPGHDYGPRPTSTLEEERRTNYVLQPRTLDEFLAFMAQP